MEPKLVYEFKPYIKLLIINILRDSEERVVVITSCIKWYQSQFDFGYEGLWSVRAGFTLGMKVYEVLELVRLYM